MVTRARSPHPFPWSESLLERWLQRLFDCQVVGRRRIAHVRRRLFRALMRLDRILTGGAVLDLYGCMISQRFIHAVDRVNHFP
jgi:hypothetical protein